MKLIVCKDYEEMSQKGADFIISELKRDSSLALGGATGSTPKRIYELLAKSEIDLSSRSIWFLDEYFGRVSYYQYSVNALFNQFQPGKGIKKQNIKIPRGIFYWRNQIVHSDTLDSIVQENSQDIIVQGPEIIIKPGVSHPLLREIMASCEDYERSLPINRLQILGIGVEGHVGFNEQGTSNESLTHLTALHDSTLGANQEDFLDGIRTRYAVTQGLRSIMGARFVALFAFGEKKAEAIHEFLLGKNPASALLSHPNLYVYVTHDTLAKLSQDEIKSIT